MENETLQLFAVGINYKTSTVSEREIFQINRKEISSALNYFNSREEVEGTVIVSTCNRLEFYLTLKKDAQPFFIVNDFFFEKKKISVKQKQNLFYRCKSVSFANWSKRIVKERKRVKFEKSYLQC